ncbi:MAG: hypothetical protein ACLUSP_08485 [Christensenellales bacterium]
MSGLTLLSLLDDRYYGGFRKNVKYGKENFGKKTLPWGALMPLRRSDCATATIVFGQSEGKKRRDKKLSKKL